MRLRLLVGLLALLSLVAHAQDWGNMAIISATLGNNTNRLCIGDHSRPGDIGCPTYAPSVTTAGDVSVTGNLSAAKFIGDGSGLTNVAAPNVTAGVSGSLIYRDATGLLTASSTLFISSTTGSLGVGGDAPATAGSNALYVLGEMRTASNVRATGSVFGSNIWPGVSNGVRWGTGGDYLLGDGTNHYVALGTSGTEAMRIVSTGYVGIGTSAPSATLHVMGPIVAGANGGTSGSLYLYDTGSTRYVFTNTSGGLSITGNSGSGSSIRMYNSTGAQTYLGVNNAAPSATIHVSGTAIIQSWTAIGFGIQTSYTATASLEVSGTVSATRFVGDGSGLTGVVAGSSDRIVSGTGGATSMVAISATGIISVTQNGTNTAYFHPTMGLVAVGVSTTGIISTVSLYVTGTAGIGIGTAPTNGYSINATSFIRTTSRLLAGDGSAGAPAFTFANDSSNGLFRPTTGGPALGFTVSQTEAMRIVSTGYVGIGTPTASTKLDVNGAVRAGNGTNFGTNDGGLLLYSNNAYKIGFDANGAAPYAIRYNVDLADSSHGHIFSAGPITSTINLMIIRGDGNVGIGTTAPGAKLVVSSNTSVLPTPYVGGGTGLVQFAASDSTNTHVVIDGYGAPGTPILDFRRALGTAGSLGTLSRNIILGGLNFAGYGATNYSGARAAIYGVSAEDWTDSYQSSFLNFYTATASTTTMSERMRIDSSGNVGISTTNPTTKLEVNGTVSATNFVGNGSGLTGVVATAQPSDRISTTGVAAGANLGMVAADKGTVSFTTGGVAGTAYLNTTGVLVAPGISATANLTSVTTLYVSAYGLLGTTAPYSSAGYTVLTIGNPTSGGMIAFQQNGSNQSFVYNSGGLLSLQSSAGINITSGTVTTLYAQTSTGNVGIGTSIPNAKLDVYGTISATNFVGNGSGLTGVVATAQPSDRISTTGVASGANLGMVAADKGTVSFTTGGVAGTAYLNTTGVLVAPGISATANLTSVTSLYASGNVGIGIAPTTTAPVYISGSNGPSLLLNQPGGWNYIRYLSNTVPNWAMGNDFNNNFFIGNYINNVWQGGQFWISATNGNVGIGMSAAAYPLTVSGSILVTSSQPTSSNIFIGGDTTARQSGLRLHYNPSADIAVVDVSASQGLRFRTSYLAGSTIMTSDALVITSTPNVGIGTSSPNAALEVSGTISATNFVGNGSGLTGIATSGDRITSSTTKVTANSTGYVSITNAGTVTGYFNSNGVLTVPGISTTANLTSVTTLYASGNVGIGTTSPRAAMEVSGTYGLLATGLVTETALAYNAVNAGVVAGTPRLLFHSFGDTAPWEMDNWNGTFRWFRPGTVYMAIVSSTGNVGIGTTTPSNTLTVSSAGTLPFGIANTSATNFTQIVYYGTGRTYSMGVGNANAPLNLNNKFFLFDSISGTARMVVDSAGRVGIGQVTPTMTLDIATGASQSPNDGIKVAGSDNHEIDLRPSLGAGSYNPLVQAGDSMLMFTTGSTNSGRVVIGPWTASNTGIVVDGPTGNIGVGTNSPKSTLQIGTGHGMQLGGDIAYLGNLYWDAPNSRWSFLGYLGATPAYGGGMLIQPSASGIGFFVSSNTGTAGQGATVNTAVNITSASYVGINTSSPGARLEIQDASTQLRLRNTSATAGKYWKIGPDTNNSIIVYNQNNNGVWIGDGGTGWNSSSDERLKQDVKPLAANSGLTAIQKLLPVSFRWKDARLNAAAGPQTGFIAQQVKKVYPLLVRTGPSTTIVTDGGKQEIVTDTLGVNYAGLVVPLVKAVQEQQQEIEQLKAANDNLKAANDNLARDVSDLKRMMRARR